MINVKEDIGIVQDIISKEQQQRAVLIHALHKIQAEENYLPAERLEALAKELDIPLSEIYSTASFYKQFYFTPRGKNIVCVCVGTACHVRGAPKVIEQMEEAFGIKAGETDKNLTITLETVGCVGCCGLAPVAVVNDDIAGELTQSKVDSIIEGIKSATDEKAGDE